MGFNNCYLGLRCSVKKAAEYLALELAEEALGEGPIAISWVGKLRDTNWTLVWLADGSFVHKNTPLLQSVSEKTDVIACEVVESVMWSSAQYWSEGILKWKVTHAGDGDDIFDLTEVGDLPEEFTSILNEHRKNQLAEDAADEYSCDHIFEVPLDLAAVYLGFRHDAEIDAADFTVLKGIVSPPRKGLVQRFLSVFNKPSDWKFGTPTGKGPLY